MPGVTYHLLTEAEPFSEFHGGAISRWAGNVLRDAANSVVVCPSADDSWKFPLKSVRLLAGLRRYRRFRRQLSRLPWFFHRPVIRHIFQPLLKRVGPVILHLHNTHLVEGPEKLMRQVHVDRLIFVSQFLMDQARRKFPSLASSSVLYNGADGSLFYPSASDRKTRETPIVLFAGRLVEDKGVHVLLDAMKLLKLQNVKVRAQIVGSSGFGSSKETEYIRRLKANCPETVTFLEYRTGASLAELFREADIFCSPSICEEGFGLVNVEAFASGLPVVSTNSGGVGEIFTAGGGILVERGSAVQLACALRQFAEDPDLRIRTGRQGYAVFRERFTWSIARTRVREIEEMLSL
jgi:spore coat protein SA